MNNAAYSMGTKKSSLNLKEFEALTQSQSAQHNSSTRPPSIEFFTGHPKMVQMVKIGALRMHAGGDIMGVLMISPRPHVLKAHGAPVHGNYFEGCGHPKWRPFWRQLPGHF
jgi:hypothetical protein